VAECPKLRTALELIVEKAAEIDFQLREKLGSFALTHDLKMWILHLINLINEIPPITGDLGLPYVEVMELHQEVLDALRVSELSPADLASIKASLNEAEASLKEASHDL
jgi:hypothetical protein